MKLNKNHALWMEFCQSHGSMKYGNIEYNFIGVK